MKHPLKLLFLFSLLLLTATNSYADTDEERAARMKVRAENKAKASADFTFLAIKIGSSQEAVKQAMKSKENGTLNSGRSNNGVLYYEGCRFGYSKNCVIVFYFYENKFCKSQVIIPKQPDFNDVNMIIWYDETWSNIMDKYGFEDGMEEYYILPYNKKEYRDREYKAKALQQGKYVLNYYWDFGDYRISMRIESDFKIYVEYEDKKLVALKAEADKKAEEIRRKENPISNDF